MACELIHDWVIYWHYCLSFFVCVFVYYRWRSLSERQTICIAALVSTFITYLFKQHNVQSVIFIHIKMLNNAIFCEQCDWKEWILLSWSKLQIIILLIFHHMLGNQLYWTWFVHYFKRNSNPKNYRIHTDK